MISYIKGILTEINTDSVTVECAGVGYEIFTSAHSISSLSNLGTEVILYTVLSHREDAMELYGFVDREDLNLFKLLLKVSGVGNKSALAIMSTFTSFDLRFAIKAEDHKAIAKAPGIGPKTAQRICIDLKDKVEIIAGTTADIAVNESLQSDNPNNVSETLEALTALGYQSSVILKTIKQIENANDYSTDDLIAEVLRLL